MRPPCCASDQHPTHRGTPPALCGALCYTTHMRVPARCPGSDFFFASIGRWLKDCFAHCEKVLTAGNSISDSAKIQNFFGPSADGSKKAHTSTAPQGLAQGKGIGLLVEGEGLPSQGRGVPSRREGQATQGRVMSQGGTATCRAGGGGRTGSRLQTLVRNDTFDQCHKPLSFRTSIRS